MDTGCLVGVMLSLCKTAICVLLGRYTTFTQPLTGERVKFGDLILNRHCKHCMQYDITICNIVHLKNQ